MKENPFKLAEKIREIMDQESILNEADRKELISLQNKLAREFGNRNGWKLTTAKYRRNDLPKIPGSLLAHSYTYLKNGYIAAITVHPYNSDTPEAEARIRKLADNADWVAEFPADFPDWYNPGQSRLVCLVAKEAEDG